MSDLTLHKLSYKDLREQKYKDFDDPYGIVAFMTDHLCETLLACPNKEDEDKKVLYLITDGNVAVARIIQFGTKLKIENVIVSAQTGGSLFVEDNYRPQGIGADLLMETRLSKDYNLVVYSNLSNMVKPMYEKMKYVFFDLPQYVTIRDTRPLVASYGLKGFPLKICSAITNLPIHFMNIINALRRKKLLKRFDIKKEAIVPKWVDDMVMKDRHKYMELHNQEWFQWNLDYNMNGYPGDLQSFYSVYDKTGKPMGFFMTKERFEKTAGRYRNIIRGTIVEWATANELVLSEADLNLIAINTFSPSTFHVLSVTTEDTTRKKLQRMGFMAHGLLHMVVLDKKKQYPDINDKNQWRLRYGCGNTIIFGNVSEDH